MKDDRIWQEERENLCKADGTLPVLSIMVFCVHLKLVFDLSLDDELLVSISFC